jgi:tetratricopeptide (TPR) repeat protein
MRRLLFVLGTLAAAPLGAAQQDGWAVASTPRFEVISDAGPAAAQADAAGLARFAVALEALLGPEPAGPPAPVVVVVLDSANFDPLRPRFRDRPVDLDGFIQAGAERRYVVARRETAGRGPGEIVRHEYVHLALARRMPVQPVWLAEGLAELFSDFEEEEGGEALLGRARPSHLGLLRTRELLPLETVLTVRDDSPLYNSSNERAVLYAQSWALAHSLIVERPDGRARLGAYLAAVGRGVPEAAAFREGFGEDLDAAERRLRAYVRGGEFGRLAVSVPPGPAATSVRPLSPGEVHWNLADLLLHAGRLDDAERHLDAAFAADPWSPAVFEARGHLALKRGRVAEARGHIRTALTLAPRSAAALYRYADSLVRAAAQRGVVMSAAEESEAADALEQAVALAPHFADAGELLARLRPNPRAARIALLEGAWARAPERADVGITLAGLYMDGGDARRAAIALERARRVAREDHVRFVCEHMLRKLRPMIQATSEVDGHLVALDCPPGGGLSFVVRHGQEQLRLHAASPVSVMLFGADGERHERTLVCGPQSVPVRVRFRPSRSLPAHDGQLLALTFGAAAPERR